MSFLTVASSIQESTPVELYTFIRGSQTWRFKSSAGEVEHEGQTYSPYPIQRGKIKQTEDILKNGTEFTFPRGSSFAKYYVQYPSIEVTFVNIIRQDAKTGDYKNWWKGRVIGTRKPKQTEILLECESTFTAQKRPGLRKMYEITCCNTLYDTDCKVSRAAFARQVEITDITGKAVTVSNMTGVDANWFRGGMIVSNTLKTYYITIHDGSVLTVFLNPELLVGDEVTIYPGCDRLRTTCKNKFNNILNFSGFPWMPDVNPYGGMSMV